MANSIRPLLRLMSVSPNYPEARSQNSRTPRFSSAARLIYAHGLALEGNLHSVFGGEPFANPPQSTLGPLTFSVPGLQEFGRGARRLTDQFGVTVNDVTPEPGNLKSRRILFASRQQSACSGAFPGRAGGDFSQRLVFKKNLDPVSAE
jgi:hypothetical protein